ncbi:MAG: APC family permease, partial [Tepidisphaeraceae bacterium]
SEQRQLPNLFAWTQARFRTPYVAILVSALVTLALTLFGTFLSALTISTITRLIAYAATCAALPVLRRSRHAPTAQFQLRAGMAIAVAALVLCAWLLSNSSWFEVRAVLAAGLAGLAMHIIFRLSTDLTKASRAR